MLFGTLPLEYLGWHYTLALKDLMTISRNLMAFVYRFFSLSVLLKTFFAPWRRLGESYKKGFYPEAWFETVILNTLMRLVGIFFRAWLIVFGVVAVGFTTAALILTFIIWLGLPLLIPVLFFSGLNLLWQ